MELGEAIHLPTLALPPAQKYPTPSLSLPEAEIPSYKPLVVPPNNLSPPVGVPTILEEAIQEEEQSRKERVHRHS